MDSLSGPGVILLVALGTSQVVNAEPAPAPIARPDLFPQRSSTPIALPELLQVALRQSSEISRTVIDINAARGTALTAAGLDDFTLTADVATGRTQAVQIIGSRGLLAEDAISAAVGLARGLESGGLVSARATGQIATDTFQPTAGAAFTADGVITNVAATFEHPLLRGFGVRIARADRRRAAVAHDVATLQRAAAALSLTRDVIIAYWQLALAAQVVEIRTEGLRLAEEQLRITQTAVRAGSVSPTEELAAEQTIAVREQALLQAHVAISEQSLDLRRKTGLEISAREIDLATTTPLEPALDKYDVDAMIARAIQENPLMALLQAKGRGAEIEVEVTSDATRPRLDVTASLGTTGFSGGTSDAIKQLATIDHPTFTIGLSYEEQLGARAARGARDRAETQRRRLHIDLEDARRETTVGVAHAIDLLRIAQKRIEVAERAIGLARSTLKIQQARFLNGKATNFDIVLRQDELQQASLNRALAMADTQTAKVTMEALTGDLLARYHIRILPP